MSYTTYISDAISVANRSFSRAGEGDHASYIANQALSALWHAYDWRESIVSLPPFWLIPLIQEYGAPFYGVPLDFYGLRQAYLVQTTASPLPRREEMTIIKNVRKEYVRGLPRDIGYAPESKAFRVYPQVPENIGASQFLIDGTYKKLAPQTTSTTLQSTLVPWEDRYLPVFIKALRWAAADVADSPTKADKFNEFMFAAQDMAGNEGLQLGDQPVAPQEALVGGTGLGYFPGINSGIF